MLLLLLPSLLLGFCLLMSQLLLVNSVQADNGDEGESGALSTHNRERTHYISDRRLAADIQGAIPAETEKLLVFAQCYGGNVADHARIKSIPNTAIASATSPDELALYGGYHDDAARELRPGDRRTAVLPHDAGVRGKSPNEHPITRGTLDLADFSLVPTSITEEIRRRYILLYFGKPEAKREYVTLTLPEGHTIPTPDDAGTSLGVEVEFSDQKDRDKIIENFQDDDAVIISVGGGPGQGGHGQQGWNWPGTAEGLSKAFQSIREQLLEEEDTSKVQFIMFVGDHGELIRARNTDVEVPPNGGRSVLYKDFESLPNKAGLRENLLRDQHNVPGFSFFATFEGQDVPLHREGDNYKRLYAPRSLVLEVSGQSGGNLLILSNFVERVWNPAGDDILGNDHGEGISILFPVEEGVFLARFFSTKVDLTVANYSGSALRITQVAQETGAIEKSYRFLGSKAIGFPLWGLILSGLVVAIAAILLLRRR